MWQVDEVRARAADRTAPVTFFCGGSRNWERFLDVFDLVVVLTLDAATLARRLDARPSDEFGGMPDERALVERLHRTGDGLPPGTPVDAMRPLAAVVDEILHLADA